MRELEQWLPTLEPPPGGLARLHARVASGHSLARPAIQASWGWALAFCVAVAALAIWLPQWISHEQQTAALTAALRATMSPKPFATGIQVAHGAAIELPSGQTNVKLYLVQSARFNANKP